MEVLFVGILQRLASSRRRRRNHNNEPHRSFRCEPVYGDAYQHNTKFVNAYSEGVTTLELLGEHGKTFHYDMQRVYTCCWAARHALSLPGDFVECGVNTGFLSRSVMSYIDFQCQKDKRFYLLDTFKGIPLEQLNTDEKEAEFEHYNERVYGTDVYRIAQQNFADFDNAVLIKGAVPETLDQVPSTQICYLSIDMNCAYPEVAAIEYFYDKLVPSAVVVFDDYGFDGYESQRKALDDFADRKGIEIFMMPTGQGVLVRPPYLAAAA